mmetsp:Transcript_34894/g.64614  ORF Transcript_34894/g.64614 Transcript_34894/m.64614 type:complete len:240 (-) Transcript_34894:53-772(-)
MAIACITGGGENAAADEQAAAPPQWPKFPDEVEDGVQLAARTKGMAAQLETELAKAERYEAQGAENKDSISGALAAMANWKRDRDAEVGAALADALKVAELGKEDGNRLFQDGQFEAAFNSYKRSIDALEGFSQQTLNAEGARKNCVTLYNNAAQALLKSKAPGAATEGARQMADKALALEPTNTKALFRRGCAHANSEDWNLARDDLQQVLRLDPGNVAARRELQKLRSARASAQKAT